MSERIEITLMAALPGDGKYRVLADAEEKARALAKTLGADHKMEFAVEVRAVSPVQRKPKPAAVAMSEPTGTDLPQRGAAHRHATAAE